MSFRILALFVALIAVWTGTAPAQVISVQRAPDVELPSIIDGNSPGFWSDGELTLFHSSGTPTLSRGNNQYSLGLTSGISFDSTDHQPVWFEAAWRDADGTLFLWYHHEPGGLCGGNGLTAPKIGAAVSYDGGFTVHDLGIVLESGDPIDCGAKNGFFAGGHGDASVILDQHGQYFYFFFTNYGGDVSGQGVAVARMAFTDRFSPAGTVLKYYNGDWSQPGIGGKVSPIFPAVKAWQRSDADSFWGPSIHWNTYLQQYVVLLNHACCAPGWPQEGIYISLNPDLSQPEGWWTPERLLAKALIPWGPGYYPQVIGEGEGETDSVAGKVSRLYVHGRSIWELVFDNYTAPDEPLPEGAGLPLR